MTTTLHATAPQLEPGLTDYAPRGRLLLTGEILQLLSPADRAAAWCSIATRISISCRAATGSD